MTNRTGKHFAPITQIAALQQRGFTLAEMAIVVVLMGIVLTMGLRMTTASLNNSAYAETASKQAQIKMALIAYLRTNGVLPCPDTKAVLNGTQVSPCTATAAASYGIVPYATLGLPRDAVQDGWGNFFTYKVANGVAPPVGMRNWTAKVAPPAVFDIVQLTSPVPAITIQQGDGVTALTTITTNAVAVILSGGKNGYGTKTVQGTLNSPSPNADEIVNATATTNRFIVRPYTDRVGALGGPFDDRIVYLLPQDLLQPLITEQTITVCKMYCPANACTGAGAPYPYCTGVGTPANAANASSCTAAGKPYATCASAATPICTVTAATPIPIGNPTPACL